MSSLFYLREGILDVGVRLNYFNSYGIILRYWGRKGNLLAPTVERQSFPNHKSRIRLVGNWPGLGIESVAECGVEEGYGESGSQVKLYFLPFPSRFFFGGTFCRLDSTSSLQFFIHTASMAAIRPP